MNLLLSLTLLLAGENAAGANDLHRAGDFKPTPDGKYLVLTDQGGGHSDHLLGVTVDRLPEGELVAYKMILRPIGKAPQDTLVPFIRREDLKSLRDIKR